jgi:hypothetical protein
VEGSGCSSATVVTITKPIPLPKKNNSLYPHADQLPMIHRFYPNKTTSMNTAAQISRTDMKHTHAHTQYELCHRSTSISKDCSSHGNCLNKGIPTRSSALRVQWWLGMNHNHMPMSTLQHLRSQLLRSLQRMASPLPLERWYEAVGLLPCPCASPQTTRRSFAPIRPKIAT